MSVGEALVHGLLGGTAAASEHYVTDWRDRVKRARDKTTVDEQRTHDATVRKEDRAQRDKEAKTQRDFLAKQNKLTREQQTGERVGTQTHQSGENKLTREQQTGERVGTQTHQTGENKLTRDQQSLLERLRQDFQAGENQLTRDQQFLLQDFQQSFTSGENQRNRQQQTSEREGAQTHQSEENTLTRYQQELLERLRQGFQAEENQLTREQQFLLQDFQQSFTSGENQRNRQQQTSEREGAQTYQSGENQRNRQQQTSEREGAQTYQSGENKLTRKQQLLVQEIQQGFQAGENKLTRKQQVKLEELRQDFQAGESELTREQQLILQELQQGYQSGENILNRQHQTSEREGAQIHQTGERDSDVTRQAMVYEDKQLIDAQYRIPNTQFTWNADQTKLIPVQPGETAFSPPVAEINKEGQFVWFSTGTSSKGLLGRYGNNSSEADTSGYKNIKTPSGVLGGVVETTVFTDNNNQVWEHSRDSNGNLIRTPMMTFDEKPVVASPEKMVEAQNFADGAVNRIAKYSNSDATDFAAWGGDKEYARRTIMQNFLKDQHLDEQGNIRTPQTSTAETPQSARAIQQIYPSVSPDQQTVLKYLAAEYPKIRNDPEKVEQTKRILFSRGFTQEQINQLIQ